MTKYLKIFEIHFFSGWVTAKKIVFLEMDDNPELF